MEGKRVNVEELKQVMAADFDLLVQRVAEAMNGAKDGRIIADTEELVRDANAEFRQRVYGEGSASCRVSRRLFPPRPEGLKNKGRHRRPI